MSASLSDTGEWPADLGRGLAIQRRVLIGLMIRQLMTKYGRTNIGFLWMILEPMILCAGVLVVRSLISRGEENGVSLVGVLWTGYIPLTLWRHLSNGGVHLLRRCSGLFYHRDISALDCMGALVGVEIAGCTLAGLIVYWVLFTFNLIGPVYDIGLLLCGWFMIGLAAISCMVVFAVLTEYFESADRFIQPFQYLFLPLCGFFFMVSWLPSYAQEGALFIPTVDCYEMIRDGLWGPAVVTHYYWWYPLLTSLVTMALALPMIEPARNKIHFG